MTVRTASPTAFHQEMLDAGILTGTGVEGVYLRSALYERVADAVCRYTSRLGADEDEEHVHAPPVIGRELFERTGYAASFPDLMGSVHGFAGDDRAHAALMERVARGERWGSSLEPTDLMLCSAACHHVYPLCGVALGAQGRRFCVLGWCFRREPDGEVTRVQCFRMLEHVYVGGAHDALAARRRWAERGEAALVALGLEVRKVPASDPFFGRAGRLLAQSQRDEELKLEMVVSFYDDRPPVAVASSNLHLDHFGRDFAIAAADGGPAHSTCIAFGIERVTLALFHRHGLDPGSWPAPVRSQLWP